MHTPFAAEKIFQIGFLPVTNTILHTLVVDLILIGTSFYIFRKTTLTPNNLFQSLVEMITEVFYNLTESISLKNAAKIFPYFITFFLFILLANLTSLLPGVGSIGIFHIGEHGHELVLIPLFRGATSDINVTLALALVSAGATHVLSIRTTGIKDYISRYISINPVNLFIGILEIVSEMVKVVSLSFRLFGNIYAGEVVLSIVSGIFAFVFPLPFMALEMIVGVVQALVFSMLTMVFMSILTTPHHAEH